MKKHSRNNTELNSAGTYTYYDIESKKKKNLSRQELEDYSNWLPHRCKEICLKVKHTKCALTDEENSLLLLLCSISIYCWGGYPKCNLPGISVSDYATDFYIQMVHQMSIETKSGWTPEKGRWASYVKWIRLKTIPLTIKRWEITKSGAEVNNFRSIEDTIEDEGDDLSYFDCGAAIDKGRQVFNLNIDD